MCQFYLNFSLLDGGGGVRFEVVHTDMSTKVVVTKGLVHHTMTVKDWGEEHILELQFNVVWLEEVSTKDQCVSRGEHGMYPACGDEECLPRTHHTPVTRVDLYESDQRGTGINFSWFSRLKNKNKNK